MLITLERYLAITFPIRSRSWFTRTKAKLQVVAVLIYASLLNVPRYSSFYVADNIYGSQAGGLNVPSLAQFDYIFRPTKLHSFWMCVLGKKYAVLMNFFDFWLPDFALLALNILSVKRVRYKYASKIKV